MGRMEQYRSLAASVRAQASKEPSPILKAEWENLAETYLRLAEQSTEHDGDLTNDLIWDIFSRSRH